MSASSTTGVPLNEMRIRAMQRLLGVQDVTGEYDDPTRQALQNYISDFLQSNFGNLKPVDGVVHISTFNGEETRNYELHQDGTYYAIGEDGQADDMPEGNLNSISNLSDNHVGLALLQQGIQYRIGAIQSQATEKFARQQFESQQIELLDPYFNETGDRTALGILHKARSLDDLAGIGKAMKAASPESDSSVDLLITQLWQLERVRREALIHPDLSFIINQPDGEYADFHRLTAVHDVLQGELTGISQNTLVQTFSGDVENTYALDDRFFDARVYQALDRGDVVDAHLVDPERFPQAGQYHMESEDVAQYALQRMESRARELGIEPKNITQAMFEGRFNPYMEDMRLAFEGLGRPSVNDLMSNPSARDYIEHLDGTGVLDKDNITEADMQLYLAGFVKSYRDEQWNERYGSIGEMQNVKSIVNGQEATINGDDIAMRAAMRIGGSSFRRQMGFEGKGVETYQDIIGDLNPADRTVLQNRVEAYGQMSPVSYFEFASRYRDAPLNFQHDYTLLRKKYHENLERELSADKDYQSDTHMIDDERLETENTELMENIEEITSPSSQAEPQTPQPDPEAALAASPAPPSNG